MEAKRTINEYINKSKWIVQPITHEYMKNLSLKRVICYYFDVGKYNIHYRYIKMTSGSFDIGYNIDYDTNWNDCVHIGYETVYKLLAIIIHENGNITFEDAVLKMINRVLKIAFHVEGEDDYIHIGKIYPIRFIEGENIDNFYKEINNYKVILETLKFTLETVNEIPVNILNNMKDVIENQKNILYNAEDKLLGVAEYEVERNIIYNVIHEQKEMVEELLTSFQSLIRNHIIK